MAHTLSMDLRSRLLAAIDDGLSCRAAAARFRVSPYDGDPLAGAAARDWRLCPEATRRRYALAADIRAPSRPHLAGLSRSVESPRPDRVEGVGPMTMPYDDAGTSGVQRFEVFTGAGRRRDWPLEVKASIVAESFTGLETVCAVARRHGLSPSQLFTWHRELRKLLISTER